MRTFEDKISKVSQQCKKCGLVENYCLCSENINLESKVEFWLLTHENELKRTNNTGRLIEYSINTTKVFSWHRTSKMEELKSLLDSNNYDVYIIMAADREEEKLRVKTYSKSNKKTVFLILDGTWKEVRKILRKSPYLDMLPIISLDVNERSLYNLRRNSDDNHLCTVEVAIILLGLVKEADNKLKLEKYFNVFLEKYNKGRCNHSEVKND